MDELALEARRADRSIGRQFALLSLRREMEASGRAFGRKASAGPRRPLDRLGGRVTGLSFARTLSLTGSSRGVREASNLFNSQASAYDSSWRIPSVARKTSGSRASRYSGSLERVLR